MMEDAYTTRAHAAVHAARQGGRLPPPGPCECCGRPGEVYHHHSYAEADWLDVISICRSCHSRVHGGSLAEPRTGRVYTRVVRPAPVLTSAQEAIRVAVLRMRKTSGINQKDAARAIGITPGFLCNIEKGRKVPSPSMADLIIAALGANASAAWELQTMVERYHRDALHRRIRERARLRLEVA